MKPSSLRKLVTVSAVLVAARLVGAALNFVTQVMLARWLGVEELGVFVLASSLGSVLAICCGVGFSAITPRFVSQYQVNDEPELLLGFLHTSWRSLAATSLVFVGGTILAVLTLPGLVRPELAGPLAIGAAVAPAIGALRLTGALSNVWRRHYLSFLPDLLLRPVLLIAAVLVMATTLTRMTASDVLWANLGVVAIAAALQGALMWREEIVPRGTRAVRAQARLWRRAGWPLVVMILLSTLLIETDVLLLGPLLPAEDLAIFNMCFRLTAFVGFGVFAINQVVAPDLSDAFAKRDRASAQLAISRANAVCVAAGLVGLACVALFGHRVLAMIGPDFPRGWSSLVILAVVQLVSAAFGPTAQLLTVGNQQDRCVVALGCGLAVLAGLNLMLVPRFGLDGASLAVLLATAFWSAWLWIAARRHVGFDASILAPVLPLPRKAVPRPAAATRTRIGHPGSVEVAVDE